MNSRRCLGLTPLAHIICHACLDLVRSSSFCQKWTCHHHGEGHTDSHCAAFAVALLVSVGLWDSSTLRSLQLVNFLDMVPLHAHCHAHACLQSSRSSNTSDFTRSTTPVIASFALGLTKRCCGDVRFKKKHSFKDCNNTADVLLFCALLFQQSQSSQIDRVLKYDDSRIDFQRLCQIPMNCHCK